MDIVISYLSYEMLLFQVTEILQSAEFGALLTVGLFSSFILQVLGVSRRRARKAKFLRIKERVESGELIFMEKGQYTFSELVLGYELNDQTFKGWGKLKGNIYELPD